MRVGAKSHGIYRIEGCLRTVKAGKVAPDAEPALHDDGSAVVRVAAGGGFSCAAFELGAPVLADRARRLGLAALVINDCVHFSALWPEVETLTGMGLAALAMCPSYSTVAPAGYVYMSAVIFSPDFRAASTFAITWSIFDQFFCPAAFR